MSQHKVERCAQGTSGKADSIHLPDSKVKDLTRELPGIAYWVRRYVVGLRDNTGNDTAVVLLTRCRHLMNDTNHA